MRTKIDQVKKHLSVGMPIDTYVAFKSYGVTRLSAIIWVLRNRDEMDITSENVSKKDRNGQVCNFAEYKLNTTNK